MNSYLLKVQRIEITDNDTGEQQEIIVREIETVPDFNYCTVDSVDEDYVICPVFDGVVHVPDYVKTWNPQLGWFE